MILKSTRPLTVPHEVTLTTELRELDKQKRSVDKQQIEVMRTLSKYEQTRNIAMPTIETMGTIDSTRISSFDKRATTTQQGYNYADRVKSAKIKVLSLR
jgi:hypothetical protein